MNGNLAQFLQPSLNPDLKQLSDFKTGKIDLPQWLNHVTQIDLQTAIQKVWVLLIELRRYMIADQQRYALIQQLESYLDHVKDVLEQHYLDNVLIDETRDRQLADLIVQLKINHGAIYHDIFNRALDKKNNAYFFKLNFNKNKVIDLIKSSAYAALYHLADLCYSLLLTKQPIPAGYWQVIYKIYHQAKSEGYLNERIEDRIKTTSNSPFKTINEVFHFILLLFILIQPQLRHNDIRALKQCMVHWLPLLIVTEIHHDLARYAIDLSTDLSPQLYFRDHHDEQPKLYITLSGLIAYLDSTLNQEPIYFNAIEEKLLTLPLKKYLLDVMTTHPLRLQQRIEVQGTLQVALGMSSAHYFLSQARYFKESLHLESELTVQTDVRTLSNSEAPVRSMTQQREQQYLDDISKIYAVNMVDKSTTGYGLKWLGKLPQQVQVGEFMIVREHELAPWAGTVIRWLNPQQDYYTDLGIERIAEIMTPMAISNPKIKDTQAVYHPALYFVDKYHKECLILPSPNLFKVSQNLMLRFGTVEIKIYLQQTHSLMKNCVIFYFELLECSKKSLLDDFIAQQSQLSTSHDLWEALK